MLGTKPIVPAKQHKVGALIGRVLKENLNGLSKVKHQLNAALCDNLLCSHQFIVYDKLLNAHSLKVAPKRENST